MVRWLNIWGLVPGVMALLIACVFASHHAAGFEGPNSVFLEYSYWLLRIFSQVMIICAAVTLLQNSVSFLRQRWVLLTLAAALASLPFYVVTVTMLDLLLGFPEFDQPAWQNGFFARLSLISYESLFLLDNHIAIAFLLKLPGALVTEERAAHETTAGTAAQSDGQSPVLAAVQAEHEPSTGPLPVMKPAEPPAFLSDISPRVTPPVLLVEAQEHYIRVYAESGHGMALYTFKKALKDLAPHPGMQVHRSWWVADSVVRSIEKRTNGYSLNTSLDISVPVSRRFEKLVLERYRHRGEDFPEHASSGMMDHGLLATPGLSSDTS